MNKEIEVLEKMLRRMEEGTLGCTGFNIVETDAFRFAIKKLKNKHQNIILKALKYYKEHEVPDNFEELAYDKGFVEELKETIGEFNSSNTDKTLKGLKEFREKNWDKTLSRNKAYEKYTGNSDKMVKE